ncbi:hypothetical protein VP01_431g1 [Puccinia sorghi]|uniref:No apical meristem-associated C-terminal domain-containing protein n=1 Tax=Puccinia sorghi TaxID=27349 RepID=A0A0L6UQV1_9BASI|nr:hypothetical protein VP01_431g1 [Puccinia sorghi]
MEGIFGDKTNVVAMDKFESTNAAALYSETDDNRILLPTIIAVARLRTTYPLCQLPNNSLWPRGNYANQPNAKEKGPSKRNHNKGKSLIATAYKLGSKKKYNFLESNSQRLMDLNWDKDKSKKQMEEQLEIEIKKEMRIHDRHARADDMRLQKEEMAKKIREEKMEAARMWLHEGKLMAEIKDLMKIVFQ